MNESLTVRRLPAKPPWLRVRLPAGADCRRLEQVLQAHRLRTVCQSAGCPNMGECWSAGTATIMILGGRCTRSCRFCGVPKGRPDPPDADEPRRVGAAVAAMGLDYVVLTSVTRDDLADGGAAAWAQTIAAVRRAAPVTGIEALVPDFRGRPADFQRVLAARPEVLAHNVETVPRLYELVRPEADYGRSLRLLASAVHAGLTAKSGLMVGLGESGQEILAVLSDLRRAGVRIVMMGQYLRPSPGHMPVDRYVSPSAFQELAAQARAMGFDAVAAGPLVRSSYRAGACACLAGAGR